MDSNYYYHRWCLIVDGTTQKKFLFHVHRKKLDFQVYHFFCGDFQTCRICHEQIEGEELEVLMEKYLDECQQTGT